MIINFGENMADVKYKTKQRDEILRFFMENAGGCFTARDVIEKVDAGEATVFRTLSALVNEGVLKRFTGDSSRGGAAHYQYSSCSESDPHIHLKCEDCGRLIHMDCGFMDDIVAHFRADHGFSVDCTRTVIYGKCESCSAGGKYAK
jgi:Fur family ferric uptake transcriptional regulator